MNFIRILLFVAFSALVSLGANAQQPVLFSSDGELSSCLINKIYQDSKGYMWIATEYGLNRFDGTTFVSYHNIPNDSSSICDNYVHTLIEHKPGGLLVGTVKGLMEWDRGSESFMYIPMSINSQPVRPHITEFIRLSNGDIWIGTAGYGIFRYKADSGAISHVDAIKSMLGNAFVSSIFEDSSHTLWIGTENRGVYRYYPSGGQIKHYDMSETNGNKISAIVENPDDGLIYIGSLDGGVDCFDKNTNTFSHLKYAGESLSVKTLSVINGLCFAGTEGHGSKLVDRSGIHEVPPASRMSILQQGKVHQIITDRDGNRWIGLYQQGIMLIPANRKMFESIGSKYSPSNSIGNGAVMALCPGVGNTLWVSCDNEGLFQLDSSGERMQHLRLPSTAMCMLLDSANRLWAGTFNSGLFCISDGKAVPVDALAGCKIYSLGEDAKGYIYIGTFGRGVLKFNPASGKIEKLSKAKENEEESNKPKDWINNLLVAPDGKVWMAHYGGISCYNPASSTLERFEGKENLVDGCLGYAITIDSQGAIWCGTTSGLYKYEPDNKTLTHFTEKDGLPNNVVCGICEDDGGNMWISTYHGIAKYVASQDRFMTFDAGDGLQSNEFTHGAFCKDIMGKIYFGGINGFSTFYPYDIDDTPRSYHPVFTQFAIFSTPVTTRTLSGGRQVVATELDEAPRVEVSPSDNTFSVGFSTLTYDNPDKIVFHYRILEHGKEWLSTMPGQNHVTFNNMSPGEYHFQVKVAGDDSPAGMRSLIIKVRPPWYQSSWAMILYAVVFAMIIYAIYHFLRIKALRRKERAERYQSEQILEAKLQFFTNISHEIRTPMTLIINPVEKLLAGTTDPKLKNVYMLIYRNAQRILQLINQLMDIRKLEKGQMELHFQETDMVAFIENAMQPFDFIARENATSFSFHHSMDHINAWIDINNFDKVLLNLFSNAFKYTPAGGSIYVTLSEIHDENAPSPLDHCLEITVADTGIGIDTDKLEKIFDRFYQADNEMTQAGKGTGIGLHLCRSLTDLHHGTIHARNRMEGGCEFVIRIPLGKSHLSDKEIYGKKGTVALPRHENPAISLLQTPEPETQKPRTKQTIAIVEDDPEIRNFLTSELSSDYKVTTFGNADEALKSILSSDVPSLIISDVMMPGTDGFALCHKIKQNVNINHTPVILISALADDKDRMLGLQAGADAYLTKPFNTDVLRSTIAGLLANRHLLKAKFSGAQEQEEAVRNISLRSHDEVLLQKIMDVINANISSSNFSVEKLASEVGLSRVHLHRKLKELTDLSARDFIKSIRMRQAARLLKEKKISVADVAYATGFASPSHFSNTFKEMYGVTPTVYASNETQNDNPPISETE